MLELRQLRGFCSSVSRARSSILGDGGSSSSTPGKGWSPQKLAVTCREGLPLRRPKRPSADVSLAPRPPPRRNNAGQQQQLQIAEAPSSPPIGLPHQQHSARPVFSEPSVYAQQQGIAPKGEIAPIIRALLEMAAKDKQEKQSQQQPQQQQQQQRQMIKQPRRKYIFRHHAAFSTGDPRFDSLGRTMCRVLRHQATELNMKVRPDGYVRVDELLGLRIPTHAGIPMSKHTVEEVLDVVRRDPKRRYSTLLEDGILYVRANQGHSMAAVQSDKLLREVKSAAEAPVCVHGTFRCYLGSILRTGLSRMGRNHVHFAAGLPNDEGVISGIEASCEVLIYLNVDKALKAGMKIYMSENKVLLTEGFGGIVPCEFFDKVVEWRSGLTVG